MQSIIGRWLVLSLLLLVSSSISFPLYANVVGADTQNFNPTTNGLDFVTVHSSETLQPGIFNLGLFLNYAINSLPNYENKSTADRTNFKDTLLSADLNMGVGLLRNLDVGISLPHLVSQDVDTDTTSGEFEKTGLTEIRVNTKYRFFGDQDGGLAAILSANFNQIEDNPFAGSGVGPTYNIELAMDTTRNKIAYGGNIGYRIRDAGDQLPNVPVEPLPNQFIASLAVSYLMTKWDTKLIGEIYGSIPAESQDAATDRELSTAELLVGIKSDVRTNLALHIGGGTELIHGTSSPDWRIYAGLNYTFGPMFSKPASETTIVRVKEGQTPIDALTGPEPEGFDTKPSGGSEMFVAKDVLFEFNSDALSVDFQDALKRMADYLKRPPGIKSLVIEGHTDSVGSNAYNMDLSQRRAGNVRKFLISDGGLPAQKVEAVGFGEEKPIADNGNFQGRALNRRVEFRIER